MLIDQKLLRVMGWGHTGDLGPITFYTTRERVVVIYDKAPPLKPATSRQIVRRNRWRNAAQNWQLLTPEQRARWHAAARRAKLRIHGYNLFVFWFTRQEPSYVRTIERQSGIQLLEA